MIVLYRPPLSKMDTFINEFFEIISNIHTSNTIILGDFNIYINQQTPASISLMHSLEMLNLKQYINFPTHIGGNTLDLVITPSDCKLILQPYKGSLITDHYSINFTIPIHNHKVHPRKIIVRQFKKITPSTFTDTFMLIKTRENRNVYNFNNLNSDLETMINQLAPEKIITVPCHPLSPWFSNDLKIIKKKLRILEKTMNKNQTSYNTLLYTTQRNYYTNSLRQSKSKYFSDILSSNTTTSKEMYQITDSLLGRKTIDKPLPDIPDAILATQFCDFFEEKVINIINKLPSILLPAKPSLTEEFSLFDIIHPPSQSYLLKLILNFKKNSPTDPIPTKLLHIISLNILESIHEAIIVSLNEGIVPSSMKKAIIIPILKKPTLNKNVLSNYRPVSQLSCLSKVLEKIVSEQLTEFLTDHNKLNPLQSAYRKHKSTETALTMVTNDLLMSTDNRRITILALIDLSSAFDTLNHQLIIRRLEIIGLAGTALKWFSSFLSDRTFEIKINNTRSKICQLKYGVPQGSVLGPIIFNICIDLIHEILLKHNIKYHMYADDLQIYMETDRIENLPSVINKMNTCLNEIKHWYSSNSLSINMSKTELLLIHNHINTTSLPSLINLYDLNINCNTPVRNLGFIIDPNLNFKFHIDKIFKIANYSLYNIRQIRPSITKKACEALVRNLVLSHLDYCNLLLVELPESHLSNSIKFKEERSV